MASGSGAAMHTPTSAPRKRSSEVADIEAPRLRMT
jgi:hypothetical protein